MYLVRTKVQIAASALQIFKARQTNHTPWDLVVRLCRVFATDAYRQNPLTMTLTFLLLPGQ